MKWTKLGQIFDLKNHLLPNGFIGFAQSPQALVMEDRVRIYFSTRTSDRPGMFLCHIAFVDFDMDFQRIIQVSSRPVIDLGGLGCFDEHGIFPLNVLNDEGKILAFYCGLNRKVSVTVDSAIGLAISHDQGLTYERHGKGPIMAASLHEPLLVADPFVIKHACAFHMWYIYGTRWMRDTTSESWDRVYKIAYATSVDGINWRRDGRQIVEDKLNVDECQALPTVVCLDGVYHMFFCYRQAFGFRTNKSNAYRLGYAHSADLVRWTRDDANAGIGVSAEGWDSEMQCYPHVFKMGDKVYMLYNGNQFGRDGFGLAVLEN